MQTQTVTTHAMSIHRVPCPQAELLGRVHIEVLTGPSETYGALVLPGGKSVRWWRAGKA